jgi:nucleoside-diphosphate-sugar epimerase
VYDLAERMGGIGYIESHRVDCAESIEIGINLLRASAKHGVERFFFSSSACAYPTDMQSIHNTHQMTAVPQLREEDAWPAQPEDGYGFAKLYMEELCRHYTEERGLITRVARYHNVYGPPGSWNDGKEKSPAALCRKVAEAVINGTDSIELWGDGRQVRSYMHVSDCVEGTIKLMNSDVPHPINLGSDRAISIEELLTIIEGVAGVKLKRFHDMNGFQGVGGRNADITLARSILRWEPRISLEKGLPGLYRWIFSNVALGADSELQETTTEVPV